MYNKCFFQQCFSAIVFAMYILLFGAIAHANTVAPCSQVTQNVSQDATSVTLSLQEYGAVDEEIVLHVDIPQSMMPTNAWGRVAIQSSIHFEDGTSQAGHVEVLEGVPETAMHFPQKGIYELTISVGYLVKST